MIHTRDRLPSHLRSIDKSAFPRERISRSGEILGYEFNDKSLLASALNTSGSSHYILHGARVVQNKRLSLYGDTVMTALLCMRWYAAGLPQNPNVTLGIKNLGPVGTSAGFGDLVVTQAGTLRVTSNMLAAVVQAVMGAVHLDAGESGNQKMSDAMTKIGLTSPLLSSTVVEQPAT